MISIIMLLFLMISLEKFGSTLSRINLMFLTYLLNFINLFPINFKSDNGTEYINKTLTTYLENFGINFIHSVPGYPQQNGRAERLNQTLNRYASTLLNSAKLPILVLGFRYSLCCFTSIT